MPDVRRRGWSPSSRLTRSHLDSHWKGEEKAPQRADLEAHLFAKGGPAAKVSAEAEKLRKALCAPKFLPDLLKSAGDAEAKLLRSLFAEELVQTVPALFRLLLALKKTKREFGLVFVTSAPDPWPLVEELGVLFSGEHPFFNGKNGTQTLKLDAGKNGRSFGMTAENALGVEWVADGTQKEPRMQRLRENENGSVCTGARECWALVEESVKRVSSKVGVRASPSALGLSCARFRGS